MTAINYWHSEKSRIIGMLSESDFYDDPPSVIEDLWNQLQAANGEIKYLETLK